MSNPLATCVFPAYFLCGFIWMNKDTWMSISFVSYKVAERDRIPDQTETERYLFPVFVFSFLKYFVFLRHGKSLPFFDYAEEFYGLAACTSLDVQHSVLARGQLPSPSGPPRHHQTKLERRCLPVSGECPGQNQPAVSVSPAYNSSVKSVSWSSVMSAGRSSVKLAAVHGEVKPAAVRCSLKVKLLPANRSEVKFAGCSTDKLAGHHSLKHAGCGWPKPAGRSSAKFASCYEVKPTGCGSFQPAGHSETSACSSKTPSRAPSSGHSSKARSSVCSSPRLESSHVPRNIVHRNYYFQSCRSYLVCWGSWEADYFSCHGHGGHSQAACFSGCLYGSGFWVHPWKDPCHPVQPKEGCGSHIWPGGDFRFQA